MPSQSTPSDKFHDQRSVRYAAAYVRISTGHQQFSIENQMQVICAHAQMRGAEVVRTYSDEARSGLSVNGRNAFQRLISDVTEGRADFDLILVYDVSRWGRFQNVDESAHYEFICRKAGVSIEYCADGFANDGSMLSTLIKGVKRTVAAEHSRELSAKIFRSHLQFIRMGFHQGGTSELGLRRMLIDRTGSPKILLADGERKNLQDDRVILVPGTAKDIQIVRDVFRMFVFQGLSTRCIADQLNKKGLITSRGNPWKNQNVTHLLRCERYIGNLVYNRTSMKLKNNRTHNRKIQWVRSEGTIEPIVDLDLFAAARRRLDQMGKICDSDLLNHLTAVWCVRGHLSCKSMKSVAFAPTPNTYQSRFGSLKNAYDRLGYRRSRIYRYPSLRAILQSVDRNLSCHLASAVQKQGRALQIDAARHVIRVDGGPTTATVVIPYTQRKSGRAGWWLYFDRIPRSDLILIVRTTQSNTEVLDYHLMPFPVLAVPTFRFTEENISVLSKYRLNSPADYMDASRELSALCK